MKGIGRITSLLGIGWLLATAGSSIIIRHDRQDVRYLEWGASFVAVGTVGERLGDGTLIAPGWVLTAAHVADVLARDAAPSVVLGGQTRTIRDVYLHPDWRPMGDHDLALLALDAPVRHIDPLPLCTVAGTVGDPVVLVGHGTTGDGRSAERRDDGRRRAAGNRIATVADTVLAFVFEPPPGGLDLEGIPGSGDSGGPAVLGTGSDACVVGVSSLGHPGPGGPGSYGARDVFGRVDVHRAWLDEVMAGGGTSHRRSAGLVLPETTGGRHMRALLALLEDPSPEAAEHFVRGRMAPGDRSVSERASALYRALLALRGARPAGLAKVAEDEIAVVLATDQGERLLGLRIDPRSPHAVTGVLTGRP